MAKHNAQQAAKAARNAAYADRFPRRDKAARRKARAARTLVRDAAWLTAHGITPEERKPALPTRRRRRR